MRCKSGQGCANLCLHNKVETLLSSEAEEVAHISACLLQERLQTLKEDAENEPEAAEEDGEEEEEEDDE